MSKHWKGMVVVMQDDIDKILSDIQANKLAKTYEEEKTRDLLEIDEETAKKLALERKNKASGFKLNLNLDDDGDGPAQNQPGDAGDGEKNESVDVDGHQNAPAPDTGFAQESGGFDEDEKAPRSKRARGCVRGIIYAVFVLAVSAVLAYFAIVGVLDLTGLFKSDIKVPVTLTEEQIKDIDEVSRVLKEAGVIDQPFIFRLFCKFTGAAGSFVPQNETPLSADMGYRAIINALRTKIREVVRVTFPEGMTIKEIAEKLEDNKVCPASEFLLAMDNHDFTHDFLSEIPDGEEYEGRFYKYEGYIFPDTYDFYVGSSGKTVLRKFFDAFDNRVDATLRAKIKSKGMKLNDAIILASLIQWEAAKPEDMYKVSRVLHNRLARPSVFPRLECDSTYKYIDIMTPPAGDSRIENLDYDTYKRKGLPIGSINNPGLEAIKAAADPSDDKSVIKCYYFATDLKTGETKYSKTLAEHEAWCRARGIGIYGKK